MKIILNSFFSAIIGGGLSGIAILRARFPSTSTPTGSDSAVSAIPGGDTHRSDAINWLSSFITPENAQKLLQHASTIEGANQVYQYAIIGILTLAALGYTGGLYRSLFPVDPPGLDRLNQNLRDIEQQMRQNSQNNNQNASASAHNEDPTLGDIRDAVRNLEQRMGAARMAEGSASNSNAIPSLIDNHPISLRDVLREQQVLNQGLLGNLQQLSANILLEIRRAFSPAGARNEPVNIFNYPSMPSPTSSTGAVNNVPNLANPPYPYGVGIGPRTGPGITSVPPIIAYSPDGQAIYGAQGIAQVLNNQPDPGPAIRAGMFNRFSVPETPAVGVGTQAQTSAVGVGAQTSRGGVSTVGTQTQTSAVDPVFGELNPFFSGRPNIVLQDASIAASRAAAVTPLRPVNIRPQTATTTSPEPSGFGSPDPFPTASVFEASMRATESPYKAPRGTLTNPFDSSASSSSTPSPSTLDGGFTPRAGVLHSSTPTPRAGVLHSSTSTPRDPSGPWTNFYGIDIDTASIRTGGSTISAMANAGARMFGME